MDVEAMQGQGPAHPVAIPPKETRSRPTAVPTGGNPASVTAQDLGELSRSIHKLQAQRARLKTTGDMSLHAEVTNELVEVLIGMVAAQDAAMQAWVQEPTRGLTRADLHEVVSHLKAERPPRAEEATAGAWFTRIPVWFGTPSSLIFAVAAACLYLAAATWRMTKGFDINLQDQLSTLTAMVHSLIVISCLLAWGQVAQQLGTIMHYTKDGKP